MKILNNMKQKIEGIKATSITLSNATDLTVKKAFISKMNLKGFRLIFNYRDLIPPTLKFQLHLHSFWYKNIYMYIPDMELEMEGTVTNTKNLGKGNFEVNVAFFPEVPTYWRECVSDLWPKLT